MRADRFSTPLPIKTIMQRARKPKEGSGKRLLPSRALAPMPRGAVAAFPAEIGILHAPSRLRRPTAQLVGAGAESGARSPPSPSSPACHLALISGPQEQLLGRGISSTRGGRTCRQTYK